MPVRAQQKNNINNNNIGKEEGKAAQLFDSPEISDGRSQTDPFGSGRPVNSL
jgi:hypothetical protein